MLFRSGDVLIARPGERIAVDGTVSGGHSYVDQASITGESTPVERRPGSFVYAGTMNQQAPLEIEVQAAPSATRLGQILRSMEERLNRKAPIVAFTDVRVPVANLIGAEGEGWACCMTVLMGERLGSGAHRSGIGPLLDYAAATPDGHGARRPSSADRSGPSGNMPARGQYKANITTVNLRSGIG